MKQKRKKKEILKKNLMTVLRSEVLKRQEMRIGLINDVLIYRKSYKYSDMKLKIIQDRTKYLLNTKLIEVVPSNYEYASTIVIPSNKNIYWTKNICVSPIMCRRAMCVFNYAKVNEVRDMLE